MSKPNSTDQKLSLEGMLDIAHAEGFHQLLLEHSKLHRVVELDLSMVEGCDTAGAQLLWAASKSAQQAGGALHFVGNSPSVNDCWSRLGLPESFLTASAH